MNYLKMYIDLIDNAINRDLVGYSESHHILPRCLGGDDDLDNLVKLTAKEHYIAHLLLHKVNPDNPKLLHAVNSFCTRSDVVSSKTYQTIRIKFSEYMKSNEANSNRLRTTCVGTIWMNNGTVSIRIPKNKIAEYIDNGYVLGRTSFRRKRHSEEHRSKISKSMTGKTTKQSTKDKISAKTKGKSYIERFGEERAKTHSDKISNSHKLKRKISFYGHIFFNLDEITKEYKIPRNRVRTMLGSEFYPECFYIEYE